MHYCKFFFKNCQPTASDRSVQVSPSQHALCDSVAVGLCCVYEYVYYDLLPLLVLWELNLWLNYCRAKWCYGSCWSWRAEPRWFYFWCHWRCKWCVPYTVIYYQYCSHSVCTFLCLCLSLKWLNDSISILPATTYLSCKGSRCTRTPYGYHAVTVAVLMTWNLFCDDLCDPDRSIDSFWRTLNTFLFEQSSVHSAH